MGSRTAGVTDQPPGAGVVEVATQERGDENIRTTLTADPGTAGTTLAVTSAVLFPATNGYKVRVENEVMTVTEGAGTLSWTVTRGVDGTSNVAHASGVAVAQVAALQQVIVKSERVASFKGTASSFRTLGNAATPQNLFSIENAAGSAVLLAVRRLTIQMDATVASIAVASQFKTGRPTGLPTGGTVLGKAPLFDTALTSSASVVVRGATASDGGAATAITATGGVTGWHQFAMRMHTLVGQILMDDEPLIPALCDDEPVILRAGEALLVQIVQAAAANNAATNHHVVNCMFEEFTLP
jgi:hypothetical protein